VHDTDLGTHSRAGTDAKFSLIFVAFAIIFAIQARQQTKFRDELFGAQSSVQRTGNAPSGMSAQFTACFIAQHS